MTSSDNSYEFEYDMAMLALKGKRFKEAEEKYLHIAHLSNSAVAWCGVGLSKMGLLINDGSTVDEVFYCFIKAKNVDKSAMTEIEEFVAKNSVEVITNLNEIASKTQLLHKKGQAQEKAGVFHSIAGTIMTSFSESGSTLTKLAGIGSALTGGNEIEEGRLTQLSANELKKKIDSIIEQIYSAILSFISGNSVLIDEFNKAIGRWSPIHHPQVSTQIEEKIVTQEENKEIDKNEINESLSSENKEDQQKNQKINIINEKNWFNRNLVSLIIIFVLISILSIILISNNLHKTKQAALHNQSNITESDNQQPVISENLIKSTPIIQSQSGQTAIQQSNATTSRVTNSKKVFNESSFTPQYYTLRPGLKRTYFCNLPDITTKRKAYIVSDGVEKVLKIQNGFGYVEFTNERGETSVGWLLMEDLLEVDSNIVVDNSGSFTIDSNKLKEATENNPPH